MQACLIEFDVNALGQPSRGGFGAADLDLRADTAALRADHGRKHAERGVQAHRVHADRIATFALFGIERIWIQRRQRAEVIERRAVRAECVIRAVEAETGQRSEEHTSELQSLMRISYAVFCLKKKNKNIRKLSISKDMNM